MKFILKAFQYTKKITLLTYFAWSNNYLFSNAYQRIQRAGNLFKFFYPSKPSSSNALNINTYEDQSAEVRISHELTPEEIRLVKQRFEKCSDNLKRILNIKDLQASHTPKIALCCSGGGFRAMLGTLGFFKGLDKIGILDSSTYASSLSGGSWFLFTWLMKNKSFAEYEKLLVNELTTDLKYTLLNTNIITSELIKKRNFGQSTSMVDIAGSCLGIKFFSDLGIQGINSTLSQLKEKIENGMHPFPIGTAIMPDNKGFEWFEFSPLEIGCYKLKSFIPTWSFGRKFENAKSLDFSPEPKLSYLLAIFGSAYGISLNDINNTIKELKALNPGTEEKLNKFKAYSLKYLNFAKEKILGSRFGDIRISQAKVNNFLYKIDHELIGKLSDRKELNLIDAGIEMNIPILPLLRKEREIDIIIICDASKFIKNELLRVVNYAKKEGIKLPPIDTTIIDNIIKNNDDSIAIFKDPSNPNIPTIIYIPVVPNLEISTKHFNTFKTRYTPSESKILINMIESKILKNKDIILNTVSESIKLKKQNSIYDSIIS